MPATLMFRTQGGFANRLRGIVCAVLWAEDLGMDLEIYWPVETGHLPCALDDIIALCQSKALKLRIIVSPTSPLYNRHDHDWMMQQLKERRKVSAFELCDFSGDDHFKIPNHFYDEKRLNHAGALLFDSLFLSTIDFK
jgi:hypothetical protein